MVYGCGNYRDHGLRDIDDGNEVNMALTDIATSDNARYSFDDVEELALAVKQFRKRGLSQTEIAAAIGAYGRMRAVEIAASSESNQRYLDRHAGDFRSRVTRR